MKILLTNDDGLDAPGISALHTAVESLGEVMVVAPASGQSAESHGVTFHTPLLTRQRPLANGAIGTAVVGTPADCVKLGLRALWKERHGAKSLPDLVISGMNHGANVGINVIYSGTIAAAVEAAFLGVPAIAVSLHIGDRARTHLPRAAAIARFAIDHVLRGGLPDAHRVISINVPRTESAAAPMPPIRLVPMNTSAGTDGYERRVAPDGQVYYWSAGNGMEFFHTAEGSDVEALSAECVTVTPLFYDLTDRALLERMRAQGVDRA
jgi:5'-nucleotidase